MTSETLDMKTQPFEVRGHGRWYAGTLIRIKRTGSALVSYTTGSGATHTKTVAEGSPWVRRSVKS